MKIYIQHIAGLGLVLWLILGTFPFALSAQSQPATIKPLGIVDAYWRPRAAQELEVGWERITFDWMRIQPNGPGDFEIKTVLRDDWVQDAAYTNREIVGMLINTPPWASATGEPSAVPDGLYSAFDSPENQWAVFLRQLIPPMAEIGIHRWIIWNRQDIMEGDSLTLPTSFAGSVEDYYRLVKIAAQTIKSIDPDAVVLVGGLVWWGDVAAERELYLHRFIDIALDDPTSLENSFYFDGVTVDILMTGQPIDGIVVTSDAAGDIVTQVQDILNQNGIVDKQIWVNELGASPTLDSQVDSPAFDIAISLDQQTDFLIQGTALALAAGAQRIGIFKLYDSNFVPDETWSFGLIREDNSERPAFSALRFISTLFDGILNVSAGRSINSRLVILEKEEQTVYLVWSFGTEAVSFWVEATFDEQVMLYNAYGETLSSPRIGIGIDDTNVYVIDTNPAELAADGTIRISGSPQILILNGAARSVWAAIDGSAVKLR